MRRVLRPHPTPTAVLAGRPYAAVPAASSSPPGAGLPPPPSFPLADGQSTAHSCVAMPEPHEEQRETAAATWEMRCSRGIGERKRWH
uniref:Uncharacterized protein n=1 Tax=Arundo donax TaxID=35708 RepID=A0A0A8XNP6_ARUDO